MSAYEHWKFAQEEPDLAITHGNYRRHKELPKFMEQRIAMQKLREGMGDEKYFAMMKEDEERNKNIREYLNYEV